MARFLTIDIGGTFIKSALIDEQFKLEMLEKRPTPKTNLDDFQASLDDLVASVRDEIAGISISCPGQINDKTGFIHSGGLISYLKLYPLGQNLAQKHQIPVTVINDANAAGLAEGRLGNLLDVDYGAVLVLGTGVGLALISKGQLFSLRNAELIPLLQRFQTRDKAQNNQEQAEQRQIGNQFFQASLQSLFENSGSAVNFINQASQVLNLEEADGRLVFEQLETGHNPDLNQLFQDYCRQIALHIINLKGLFDFDRILIGGGISQQELLIEEIKRQYDLLCQEQKLLRDKEEFKILSCHFHNQANLIGAFCHFQDMKASIES
ncbi:ROK family protein [Streptococcus loxodontisalivarius]|uniref:NBD/HSP70 family sugar kinase n=1 Tax=Streptococcus loxodontisalivarius TaxID=1349415 RepID=A0ABS2PPL8_9STRE|nr:ROK family protein [Streptococcus loxodontisalivarius]MBM7641986.1 putative NBD/HSP70 family sugar kinase [Streptococcus loxodontisalivarius]